MAERFFSETPITGPLALLAGSEAHHLLHVMRAKPGDRVILFDGSGTEFLAQVQQARRAEVQLQVIEQCAVDRERVVSSRWAWLCPKAIGKSGWWKRAWSLGWRPWYRWKPSVWWPSRVPRLATGCCGA